MHSTIEMNLRQMQHLLSINRTHCSLFGIWSNIGLVIKRRRQQRLYKHPHKETHKTTQKELFVGAIFRFGIVIFFSTVFDVYKYNINLVRRSNRLDPCKCIVMRQLNNVLRSVFVYTRQRDTDKNR